MSLGDPSAVCYQLSSSCANCTATFGHALVPPLNITLDWFCGWCPGNSTSGPFCYPTQNRNDCPYVDHTLYDPRICAKEFAGLSAGWIALVVYVSVLFLAGVAILFWYCTTTKKVDLEDEGASLTRPKDGGHRACSGCYEETMSQSFDMQRCFGVTSRRMEAHDGLMQMRCNNMQKTLIAFILGLCCGFILVVTFSIVGGEAQWMWIQGLVVMFGIWTWAVILVYQTSTVIDVVTRSVTFTTSHTFLRVCGHQRVFHLDELERVVVYVQSEGVSHPIRSYSVELELKFDKPLTVAFNMRRPAAYHLRQIVDDFLHSQPQGSDKEGL